MPSLTICIPTYKRNLQLKALLAELQDQAIPSAVEASILVIDNNPDGRARPIAETAAGASPEIPIRYVHETRPGVAHVRNAALDQCAARDFLVFIDDDETPATGWLGALYAQVVATNAAAVFGSVEARYAEGAADWLLRGDFHSKRVETTGMRHKPGATDNCLIDLAVVRALGLRFDPALSTVGGEDTLFFDSMLQQGAELAQTEAAVTFECVPADRANLDWLLTRWRRTGFTDALMIAKRRGGSLTRLRAGIDGLLRIGAGSGLTAAAWLVSGFRMHERVARALYTYQRGRGMMDYVRDRTIEEYGRNTDMVAQGGG